MIADPLPRTNPNEGTGGAKQPVLGTRDPPPISPPTASTETAPSLDREDFVAALKGALRDFHSPDLLAQNPLLRQGIGDLGPSAGPSELRELLSETAARLFNNPRDEKLLRVIELTYFRPH